MPDVETNANLKLFTISLETKTNSAAAFMNESCFLARNVAVFTSVFGLLMGRSSRKHVWIATGDPAGVTGRSVPERAPEIGR